MFLIRFLVHLIIAIPYKWVAVFLFFITYYAKLHTGLPDVAWWKVFCILLIPGYLDIVVIFLTSLLPDVVRD